MPRPYKDKAALAVLQRHLRRRPRTADEVAELMGVTKRTAYRWLRYLDEAGTAVARRRGPNGDFLYFLL